jgi:hypothetical protein
VPVRTLIAWALAIIALASCVVSEAARALLLGWVSFLWNVLPRVSTDRPTLVLAGVAFGLFVAGIHGFGVAWSWRRPAEGEPRRRWRAGWSLAAGVLVVVLFAAGTSLVGVVHQTAWLATGDKPWFGPILKQHEGIAPAWARNDLRYVSLGMRWYHESHRAFPPGGTFSPEGEMLHSWETLILPSMGYWPGDLDLSLSWRSEKNAPTFRGVVPQFINPGFRPAELWDGEGFGLSHYAANVRVMGPNQGMKTEEITDGTSNTILLGEVNTGFQPWGHPVNYRDPADGISRTPKGFGGARSDGPVTFVMADGSIRMVTPRTSRRVLHALATPAGGEDVPVGAEELEP